YNLFLDNSPPPGNWGPGFDAFNPDAAWVLASYPDGSAIALAQSVSILGDMWQTTARGWIDRASDLRTLYATGPVAAYGADVSRTPVVVVPAVQEKDNGIWGRLIGLFGNTDSSQSFTPFPGQPITIQANYNQSLGALEAGVDHAMHGNNGTWVLGLLGGYQADRVKFTSAGDSGRFQGPFAGVYADWLKGPAYVDALF